MNKKHTNIIMPEYGLMLMAAIDEWEESKLDDSLYEFDEEWADEIVMDHDSMIVSVQMSLGDEI